VGWRNVHSHDIANKELPNLDICLVHAAFEERWIPHLMIYVYLGVCGLFLGTTPVSHLSHEARDTVIIQFCASEKEAEKELISFQV
jgi:hypothetical protein